MTVQSVKINGTILSAIIETRTALLQAASQLSLDAQNTVFLGVWSVKDLIAHLIGWDFANLAAAKDIQAGKRVRVLGYNPY